VVIEKFLSAKSEKAKEKSRKGGRFKAIQHETIQHERFNPPPGNAVPAAYQRPTGHGPTMVNFPPHDTQ